MIIKHSIEQDVWIAKHGDDDTSGRLIQTCKCNLYSESLW
ncbi:hypothetical protein AMI01nite_03030 [Aneurinibacillus migulanus]|nr:hypothetical protein AMI01nite_03030 [Aneurinibacillus migulanus]